MHEKGIAPAFQKIPLPRRGARQSLTGWLVFESLKTVFLMNPEEREK
jgi:hypothetical protein